MHAGVTPENLILLLAVLLRNGHFPVIRLRIGRASSDEPGIRPHPGRGINARLHPHGMNGIAHGLHVRKALVGLDGEIPSASLALPAIVNIDIGPAMVDKPPLHKKPGRLQHILLPHGLTVGIPAAPTHGRGQAQLIPHLQNPLLRIFSMPVGSLDLHLVFPLLRRGGTRNQPARIHPQAGGKPSRLNLHGTLPGNGNLEQHPRAGSGANNAGAVDGGGKRGFRSQAHAGRGSRIRIRELRAK